MNQPHDANSAWLTISSDESALQAARHDALAYLAEPHFGVPYEGGTLYRRANCDVESARRAWRTQLENATGPIRAETALRLLDSLDSAGADVLTTLLNSASGEETNHWVVNWFSGPCGRRHGGRKFIEFLHQQDGLCRALVAGIRRERGRMLEQMTGFAARFEIPGWFEAARERWRDPAIGLTCKIAQSIAAGPLDAVDLEVALAYVAESAGTAARRNPASNWFVVARFMTSDRSELRTRAWSAVADLQALEDDPRDRMSFDEYKAVVNALPICPPPERIEWLMHVARQSDDWQAARCVRAVLKLDPPAGCELLRDLIEKPDCTLDYFLDCLRDAFEHGPDFGLNRAVLAQARRPVESHELLGVYQALLLLPQDAGRKRAGEFKRQLPPYVKSQAEWWWNGWNLEDAREDVVAAGVLTHEEFTRTLADRNEFAITLKDFLHQAHRIFSIDPETGCGGFDHLEIFRELTDLTRGDLQPEFVSETFVETSEDHPVQRRFRFIDNGLLYDAALETTGDWYDVAHLFLAVEAAHKRRGVDREFVPMTDAKGVEPYYCELLYGEPAKIRNLIRKYSLVDS